jgi:hypothetical protein
MNNKINKIKTYKILINSKPFANMRGASPAEVAKKAASKILGNSLNRVRFSIQAKTGKIRHYDAKLEYLVRPYHKNGKLVKYRIVVKKLGKQIGGTYPPKLDDSDPIFTFFPRGEYKIENLFGAEFIIYDKEKKNKCIELYTLKDKNGDYLYLNGLFKCGYQGKKNLELLVKYGKYLKEKHNINKIVLEDASEIINTKIQLWLLSILSTGESWYNSLGFFSDIYEEEIPYNNSKILMNIEDFINECISLVIKNKKEMYKLNNSKITEFNEQFDEQKKIFFSFYDKSKSVQEIFIQIKEELKKEISEEKIKIIEEILSIIEQSKNIKYKRILTLTL